MQRLFTAVRSGRGLPSKTERRVQSVPTSARWAISKQADKHKKHCWGFNPILFTTSNLVMIHIIHPSTPASVVVITSLQLGLYILTYVPRTYAYQSIRANMLCLGPPPKVSIPCPGWGFKMISDQSAWDSCPVIVPDLEWSKCNSNATSNPAWKTCYQRQINQWGRDSRASCARGSRSGKKRVLGQILAAKCEFVGDNLPVICTEHKRQGSRTRARRKVNKQRGISVQYAGTWPRQQLHDCKSPSNAKCDGKIRGEQHVEAGQSSGALDQPCQGTASKCDAAQDV